MRRFNSLHEESDFKPISDKSYSHSATVLGHKIRHSFISYSRNGQPNHYDVDFNVGGTVARDRSGTRGIKPEHKMAILHHVSQTVHKFVKEKKPASLSFSGVDASNNKAAETKKNNLYHRFGHYLADKHNAEHGPGAATVKHSRDIDSWAMTTVHFHRHG